ncbi:hypothetical protein NE237_021994 [Protea cynaroides]|uniref:Uncharacterized protein n=1 Tax=Protea cynaroides TaxID=273540 RepID=A0A9Q0HA63_9MAGN|nr:hypothetical protein NE237_021994 [Protea cynaroides]
MGRGPSDGVVQGSVSRSVLPGPRFRPKESKATSPRPFKKQSFPLRKSRFLIWVSDLFIFSISFSCIITALISREKKKRGEERGRHNRRDVGLGTSVRGRCAVRAAIAGIANPGAGSKSVHRVWQLPNQWGVRKNTGK